MKTFKLISLQILDGEELKDFELEDGLIINREDETSTWLMEAYMNKSYFNFFQESINKGADLIALAVITKKENDPAAFQTKVKSVKILEDHISVLFEGKLKQVKSDYAELLLHDLLQKGLIGDTLLEEFKTKMISKPKLASIKK